MAGYIGSKTSVTQIDGYNRTQADAEFVQVSGDTMTGTLNLAAGNLLSAGNTTYQILNVYSGSDSTTYTSTTTTSDPGATMSAAVNFSPTTSTSKLLVLWYARFRIARVSTTGNDARASFRLRYYDGTTYSGNAVESFEGWFGLVNVAGSGNDPQLLNYDVLTVPGLVTQSQLRSDTGSWTLRFYGWCDYTSNEVQTTNVAWIAVEVDNGTA